jgi:glycine dehydrogenase subunit 2
MDDLAAKLDDQVAVFMITNPIRWGCSIGRSGNRRLVHARRLDLPGRGEHERHPRHHPAGRLRRRHDALQPAQDLQRPARRRRARRRADLRHREARAVSSLPPVVIRDDSRGRPLSAGLRPPQVDRPGAQLFRQRRRAGAGLLLHPHPRPGRAAPRGSENAVLNANYLLSRVKHFLPVPRATAACTSSSRPPS